MASSSQQYTESEMATIAEQIINDKKAKEPEEIGNLSFDLTDDEIAIVTKCLMELNVRWQDCEFDLSKQSWMRDEITTKMAALGFIVSVGWLPAAYVNPRNEYDQLRVMVPDVTIVDRVGGLETQTDHDRKKYDAQAHRVDEITPLPEVTKKLID